MELLRHRQQVFGEPVEGVVYCYSEMQPAFHDPPGGAVTFHHGLPSHEQMEEYFARFEGKFFVMVFDDLFAEMADSSTARDVATKLVHHRHFTSITLTQNVFAQGKAARSQAVNSQFYILTRTCRDLRQIMALGDQIFPGKGKRFLAIYQDAVDSPLSADIPQHLLVNCHPFHTDRCCQLLANILPPNARKVLYRL